LIAESAQARIEMVVLAYLILGGIDNAFRAPVYCQERFECCPNISDDSALMASDAYFERAKVNLM